MQVARKLEIRDRSEKQAVLGALKSEPCEAELDLREAPSLNTACGIIAASDRARRMLGWTPQYDDLATIIAHALAWDEQLQEARPGAAMRPDDP